MFGISLNQISLNDLIRSASCQTESSDHYAVCYLTTYALSAVAPEATLVI